MIQGNLFTPYPASEYSRSVWNTKVYEAIYAFLSG